MKKIFILLLFFCPMMVMAQIEAQKGDIIVFNAPFQMEKIKVQLFQCIDKQTSCKNWKPLTMPSPMFNPGAYYVFNLTDQDKTRLAGSEINIKVYGVSEKQWSSQLTFITKYNADENPFYQFICWSRKNAAPNFVCTNSDNSVQKGYFQKFLRVFSYLAAINTLI